MKPKSQKDRVRTWLLNGHTLTPLQALRRFKSLRFGAIIYDLRNEGMNIHTEMVKVGHQTYVAKYRLI